MNYTKELAVLIINNVRLVEESNEVLGEIDDELFTELGNYIKSCLQKSNIYDNFNADSDIKFFRSKWPKGKNDESIASIWLDCDGEYTEYSWLSILTGQLADTYAGLFLWIEHEGIRKTEWKQFMKTQYRNNPSLEESGFILNKENTAIVYPFRIEASCLIDNYPDIKKCFSKIGYAIDMLDKNTGILDTIIKNAKELIKS